jgi:hypothetical protein
MKYPNINLNARPDGMSVAQAAEVLRDQREEERRKLIFGLAMAAIGTETGYEDARDNPLRASEDLADYVNALQFHAYSKSLETPVDPTQILATEIADESLAAQAARSAEEWLREPKEDEEMPGCPLGCSTRGCEHPDNCEHQAD